jgi:outer membrane protein assembly factor BamE (lipoprotein component of BamABCDE complex)
MDYAGRGRKARLRLLALAAFSLACAGCGLAYQAAAENRAHRLTNWLKPGQTVTEVRDKFGEPDIRRDFGENGQVWSYAERANSNDITATILYTSAKEGDTGKFIDVSFVNGKVTTWREAEHTMPPKQGTNFGYSVGLPTGGNASHY